MTVICVLLQGSDCLNSTFMMLEIDISTFPSMDRPESGLLLSINTVARLHMTLLTVSDINISLCLGVLCCPLWIDTKAWSFKLSELSQALK